MPDFDHIFDLFPNPATPDLGCFVRRKHGLEIEPFNIHVEFAPSIDQATPSQQLYFRVKCGEAAFHQRALVFMTTDASIPGPILQQFPPDWILGGDHRPFPSDWFRLPSQTGQRLYWFFGQHRDPNGGAWRPDAFVGHSYDIYERGTLSHVQFDDTGGDRDMDDFILEVALVKRFPPVLQQQVEGQREASERFERERLPKLLASLPTQSGR